MSETVPKASLGILCDLVAGGTPSTSDLSLWSDDPVVGHPWIAIGDMSRRKNVSSTMKHVSDKGLEKARLPVGEPGTVLFAIYASVGETAILDIRATWNQAILGLSPKDKTKLDSKFLYYALLTLRPELPIHYRSNTQHNLNAETVSRLQIPLPSLETQRRIADYLDRETGEIDAMIDKLDELAARLKGRRTAVIDHVLNRFPFISLEIGWNVTDCLHKTAKFVTGGDNYVVSIGQLDHFEVDTSNALLTTDEDFQNLRSGGREPKPGDAVMSRNASVGKLAVVTESTPPFALGQDVVLLSPRSNEDASLLSYCMTSSRVKRSLELSMQGTTFKRINVASIKKLPWVHIPESQLEETITHLDDVTSKVDAMLAKVDELKDLLIERRAALITDVVTGRKDVA